MLHVHQLTKRYSEPLFENVTFHVQSGERVGLIGPNGSGKTTMLRILMGEEKPDSGTFSYSPADLSIGYLSQGVHDLSRTVDEILHPDQARMKDLEEEMGRIAESLFTLHEDQRAAAEQRYEDILREVNAIHAGMQEYRAGAVLEAFDLGDIHKDTPVGELSGGQKTRLGLARIQMNNPDLLLLDEPTNHLDITMLEWLEEWLQTCGCAALIVSHDRMFLERTVTRILAMDPASRTVRSFDGTYSDYLDRVSAEQDRARAAYQDQAAELRRMKQDIARIKQQALATERSTKNDSQRRYAKKVARKAVSREKKLTRYLESDDRLEKPVAGWQMKVSFAMPDHMGKLALVLQDLAVGYPGSPPLLEGINLELGAGERVVLTGPNGCGKSTLLKTIAGTMDAVRGQITHGSGMRMGYMAQEQEDLDPDRTVLEYLRASMSASDTELRSFLHFFLFSGDDPLRRIGLLSYGERVRFKLAALVAQGCTFLLLDEPINHLDIPSRECFEQALAGFRGTVLAVVHDRMFIARYAHRILGVEGYSVRELFGVDH